LKVGVCQGRNGSVQRQTGFYRDTMRSIFVKERLRNWEQTSAGFRLYGTGELSSEA
jgi:hypothetical protein